MNGMAAEPAQLAPPPCPAYILAGGQSSRFGSDKALISVAGQPQLLRLRDLLERQGHATHVVADRPDRYEPLQISCLVDVASQSGPLAGLAAALTHRLERHGPGWLLLVNCDQLSWLPAWYSTLTAASAAAEAVVFGEPAQLQPLPGLYHSHLLSRVVTALEAGHLSLRRLLTEVRAATVMGSPLPQEWSFNTPDELAQLISRLQAEPPRSR